MDLEPGQVFVVASPDIETPLRSLSLDPDSATLAAGTEIELKAFGLFSDRSSLDLTGTARWSSSDETVATVEGGVVRAESAGGALITATVGEVSATAEITVSDAELVDFQVSAVGADTIAAGTRAEFRAVGTFSDETEQDVTSSADWTSVSDEIATIVGPGLAKGEGVGTTEIRATFGAFSDSADLTVIDAVVTEITVTTDPPSLLAEVEEGLALELRATATFSDETTQDVTDDCDWTSINTGFATVSNTSLDKGLVNGVAVGTVEIVASFEDVQGELEVEVLPTALTRIENLPAGTYTFDTDTGILDDDDGPVFGWNASLKTVDLLSFNLASGVTINLTGSEPFTLNVTGDTDVIIAGTLDFSGAGGTGGSAPHGQDGGDISIQVSEGLSVSGSILSEGGDALGAPGVPGTGGNGGNIKLGGATLEVTDQGTVQTTGGNGTLSGSGGDGEVSRPRAPSPPTIQCLA